MKHDPNTAQRKPSRTGRAGDRAFATALDAKKKSLRVVNGRLVGPTLADPGMDREIRQWVKAKFPDRDAVLEHFHKSGVLTKTGKLTKAYGG